MKNTTPLNKVVIDLADDPELKNLVSKLQPGDQVKLKSGTLQLDQSDDSSVTFSIVELEFTQPKSPAKGGGDTALDEEPGLKVIKGDLEAAEESDETPDEEAVESAADQEAV